MIRQPVCSLQSLPQPKSKPIKLKQILKEIIVFDPIMFDEITAADYNPFIIKFKVRRVKN